MRRFETVLGFLVLLVVCLFSYTLWKSWHGNLGDTYELRAIFSDAGGIAEGDPIKVSGVPVGRVQKVLIEPQDYRALVYLTINKDIQLPVDTQASIVSAGFLSGLYIRLVPGKDTSLLGDGAVMKNLKSYESLENQIASAVSSVLGG